MYLTEDDTRKLFFDQVMKYQSFYVQPGFWPMQHHSADISTILPLLGQCRIPVSGSISHGRSLVAGLSRLTLGTPASAASAADLCHSHAYVARCARGGGGEADKQPRGTKHLLIISICLTSIEGNVRSMPGNQKKIVRMMFRTRS
jgi:hypothetical protein